MRPAACAQSAAATVAAKSGVSMPEVDQRGNAVEQSTSAGASAASQARCLASPVRA